MAKILCIETTTKTCAVGLSSNGFVQSAREDHSDAYSHAEQLHVFIEAVMAEAGEPLEGIDAIAVSGGPGSYTGLRIGVSAAKGIAYALKVPLISVDPLKALAAQVSLQARHGDLLIPMIDARRMEVFCAGFDAALQQVFDTKAQVVDEHAFVDMHAYRTVYYFGDGADKCYEVLSVLQNFKLIPGIKASIAGMASIAERAFCQDDFVDVAYFEPYYLKDFVAGRHKKNTT